MKTFSKVICFLTLFGAWIFMPGTVFYGDLNTYSSKMSPDKKYRVVIYKTLPLSPYAVYKILNGEYFFFILYDANGKVIFRPPLYHTLSFNGMTHIQFDYQMDYKSLLFPGENGSGNDGYDIQPCTDCFKLITPTIKDPLWKSPWKWTWEGPWIWQSALKWETVSRNFFKDTDPFMLDDLHIRDKQIIAFRTFNKAETAVKPATKEYTEPWKNNFCEKMNQRTVKVMKGSGSGPVQVIFKQPGQRGNWWLSPDWKVIYVSAYWENECRLPNESGSRQLTRLFKSTDGGQTWQQLNWSPHTDIGKILFLDAQRGYIVSSSRIWRTADGGASWTEIPSPVLTKDQYRDAYFFDLIRLGKDGVLRFAFSYLNPQQRTTASQIYALNWNNAVPSLIASLPDQVVKGIIDYQHSLYILTQRGSSALLTPWKWDKSSKNKYEAEKTALFRLSGQHTELLHEFDPLFKGDSLYLTPGGGILITDLNMKNLSFITAISYSLGKSWKIKTGYGNYYHEETGIFWKVQNHQLSKHQFP